MSIKPEAQERPLYTIAAEIYRLWKPVNYAALPYLQAMAELDRITDSYYDDSADRVVSYFLSNTRSWTGPDAHRIKNELRAMVGQKLAPAPKGAAKPARPVIDQDVVDQAKAERKIHAAVVKAAVMRAIFCPFTGDLLDMRRAVVIVTPAESFVCTGTHWDESLAKAGGLEAFTERASKALGRPAEIKVYDGRKLFTPAGRVR